MALFTFRLPDIGEGISEAEIVGWHVKVGDRVEEDQPIADMMTDKATVEMESPVAGVVTRLAGEVGDQIAIGAMLVEIEVEGEAEAAGGERPSEEEIAAETPGAGEIEPHPLNEIMTSSVRPEPVEGQDGGFDKLSPNGGGPAGERVLASPAVRARAKDLGIDLAQVKASGDHIRHSDLDAFLLYRAGQGYRPAGQRMKRADEVIKVIGLRRRIAENMAASKRHIPHFSYVEEIDVTELERMRAQLNGERGDRPKLGRCCRC